MGVSNDRTRFLLRVNKPLLDALIDIHH